MIKQNGSFVGPTCETDQPIGSNASQEDLMPLGIDGFQCREIDRLLSVCGHLKDATICLILNS